MTVTEGSVPLYPFSALVGQETLRLALLLCATDPALGVLLRGDKGAAKSTAARALAELLPDGTGFVNLPVGASEDRLLGGLDLERALAGESALKPGLLAQAHRGVLYCDEVNLLPGHLIDALLDAAASGVNRLERDGFSVEHPARFVLLGSMNPEEGALRPQLLDRFALVAEVHAPLEVTERREILARRLGFDADPHGFRARWEAEQSALRARLALARNALPDVELSPEVLTEVADTICRHGVSSLRADLALVRAARAYAALHGRGEVTQGDLEAVLPLVLAHRLPPGSPPPPQRPPPPEPSPPPPEPQDSGEGETPESGSGAQERIFTPLPAAASPVHLAAAGTGRQTGPAGPERGRVTRVVPLDRLDTGRPAELDLRASLLSAAIRPDGATLSPADLHGRVREPVSGRHLTLVIDASGSHAQGERMRAVKGAALALLDRLAPGDTASVVAFRGARAEVLCPPTRDHPVARRSLEYLPTGGRTPLAHALTLTAELLADAPPGGEGTVAVFTDGRANVPLTGEDPWQDALDAARRLRAGGPQLDIRLIDTERGPHPLGRARLLSDALGATYTPLEN